MRKEPFEYESDTSVARRMYSAISYMIVLFGIGIPMWWYTTQLYRMALPDERMQNLGTAPLQIQISLHIVATSEDFKKLIISEIEDHFKKSEIINININEFKMNEKWLPKNIETADNTASKIINDEFVISTGDIMLIEWPKSPHEIVVTSSRIIYFNTETTGPRLIKVLSKWILQEDTLNHMVKNMKQPTLQKQDSILRKRVSAADRYDVLVTVVNPDPEWTQVNWNVKNAAIQYLTPFFQSISHISNVTLKSQWLYYVTISDKLEKHIIADKNDVGRNLTNEWNNKRFTLNEQQLPYLITMFETKLASHVSKNPCLNLIVYINDCKHAPLQFFNPKGNRYDGPNAFMSPRWGGVIFINPEPNECKKCLENQTKINVTPDSQYVMSIFITQLRQLLGIPEVDNLNGVYLIPITSSTPRQWELDALMRLRTFEQILSARLTLKSLAQLLTEITTIVINDDVGASIHSAVDNAEIAAEHLLYSDLHNAFIKSRMAFLSSEAAFYDPSLLALLYFPDDQKYAIYIPLFLPIMIPVIISLNTIRAWLVSKPEKATQTD